MRTRPGQGKEGPDGYYFLKIAEVYGQSPQDVENWEEYWLLRAIALMEGQGIYESVLDKRRKDQERTRRR